MNLPLLPKGWIWIRLGDGGFINPKFSGADIPEDLIVSFLPMRAVEENSGKIDLSLKKKLSELKKGYTSFLEGDLLFAKITPCMENGKVAFAKNLLNGIGFGSTEFHIIRVCPPLDRTFLFFFLIQKILREDARKNMKGTAGQLRVPASYMEQIPVPLPPLPEQHRIVAKIEELFSDLDAGVEALKKAKAQLKLYRQAVLKAAFEGRLTAEWREAHRGEFKNLPKIINELRQSKSLFAERLMPSDNFFSIPNGWEWIELNKITQSMQNGIYKPKDFYNKDGIACLRMYNIENWAIIWKDIKRMVLSEQEIETYALKENDILINRVNSRELVGKSAVIPHGLEKCVYESKNIRLRIKENYTESKFVNYWLQLNGRRYFDKNTQQTVGMASINQEQIGAMPIPYTILSEQQEIIKEIEYRFSIADETEKIITQSFGQSDRLRQSILKQAFSGQLIPQDPEDEPAETLLARIREEKAKHLPVKELKRKAIQRKLDYGQ